MKKLLSLLFLFFSLLSYGQQEKFNRVTYDTVLFVRNAETNTIVANVGWVVRITRDAQYFSDIAASSANQRPVIVTWGGKGEVASSPVNLATDTPLLSRYGPEWQAQHNGFDYGIVLQNGKHFPVYVTVLQASVNIRPWYVYDLYLQLKSILQPRGGVFLSAGLSEGSWIIGCQLPFANNTTGNTGPMSLQKAWVDLEGVGPETFQSTDWALNSAFATWVNTFGGRFMGIEGVNDSRNIVSISGPMNTAVANSAYFTYSQFSCGDGSGTGGHGCWNSMYGWNTVDWRDIPVITNPNLVSSSSNTIGNWYRDNIGTSIFQWMLRQTDTTLVQSTGGGGGSTYNLPYKFGLGEYQSFHVGPDSIAYGTSNNAQNIGSNGANKSGIPQKCVYSPADPLKKIIFAAGSLHAGGLIDIFGNVWLTGENPEGQLANGTVGGSSGVFTQVLTDSMGNAFTNVKQIIAGYSANAHSMWYAIKNDGTLWMWGPTFDGMRGDGTYGCNSPRPIPLALPGGRLVAQLVSGAYTLVLATDGTVWSCGGAGGNGAGSANVADLGNSYTGTGWLSWKQVGTLTGITQIAGGIKWSYAYNKTTRKLYGWGSWDNYLGHHTSPSGGGNAVSTPTELTAIEAIFEAAAPGYTINKIITGSDVTHAILSDSTLWGWGDNAQGNIGNGTELNWSTYQFPWSFDLGTPGVLLQIDPVNIAPGIHDWVEVTGGGTFNYHHAAERVTGRVYNWGRNKVAVQWHGITAPNTGGAMEASYPNSWDRPLITEVFLSQLINNNTTHVTETEGCVTGQLTGSPCNLYTPPTNVKPTAGLVITQLSGNRLVLDASSSTDDEFVSYYELKLISGASNIQMGIRSGKVDTISVPDGNYTFREVVKDNHWLKDSIDKSVTVGASTPAPTVTGNPASISVRLPVTSATLSCTVIYGGTNTFASALWTQLSGAASIIVSPTSQTTNLTGLAVGVYTYNIKITDNQGLIGNATVTVTVSTGGQTDRLLRLVPMILLDKH